MAFAPLSRRAFLRHTPIALAAGGTAVSTAALAGPVLAHRSSLSPEIERAVLIWQKTMRDQLAIWDGHGVDPEAPIYAEWNVAFGHQITALGDVIKAVQKSV